MSEKITEVRLAETRSVKTKDAAPAMLMEIGVGSYVPETETEADKTLHVAMTLGYAKLGGPELEFQTSPTYLFDQEDFTSLVRRCAIVGTTTFGEEFVNAMALDVGTEISRETMLAVIKSRITQARANNSEDESQAEDDESQVIPDLAIGKMLDNKHAAVARLAQSGTMEAILPSGSHELVALQFAATPVGQGPDVEESVLPYLLFGLETLAKVINTCMETGMTAWGPQFIAYAMQQGMGMAVASSASLFGKPADETPANDYRPGQYL